MKKRTTTPKKPSKKTLSRAEMIANLSDEQLHALLGKNTEKPTKEKPAPTVKVRISPFIRWYRATADGQSVLQQAWLTEDDKKKVYWRNVETFVEPPEVPPPA